MEQHNISPGISSISGAQKVAFTVLTFTFTLHVCPLTLSSGGWDVRRVAFSSCPRLERMFDIHFALFLATYRETIDTLIPL